MSEGVRIEDVKSLKTTDKALLVEIDGDEVWIPKAAIHDDSEVYGMTHEGTLVVEPWFAKVKGWE